MFRKNFIKLSHVWNDILEDIKKYYYMQGITWNKKCALYKLWFKKLRPRKLRVHFLLVRKAILFAVERSSNLHAFLRPVIGFGVRAQSTRNSQTSSHFDGVFAEASTGASAGRWKMSDKTNGSIFGDGSILAIRRCRETNGLVDVYLLRRATSIVECSRNRASRIRTSDGGEHGRREMRQKGS